MENDKRILPPGGNCPRGSDLYSNLGEYGSQLSSSLACISFKRHFQCTWCFLSFALDRYTKDGTPVQREGRQWPHSGFNIHNEVEISASDEKGRQTLAQYIIKAPISQERMMYDKENQKVIYNSKHGMITYEHKTG